MYVRTKITDNCNCVYIRKIIEIDDVNVFRYRICIDEDVIDGWRDDRIYIEEEDISKASYKIISLIEDGDYVNGEKVEDVILDNKMSRIKTTECSTYFEEDIKSIVTKEQFESMSYKVGD